MAILTLLPKIDILRLTKRRHKKEPLDSVKQPTVCHFYNTRQSLCPPPTPHSTISLQCVLKSQMKILTVSELVPKMESKLHHLSIL